MKKLLFVFNPLSGKAKIKNHLCQIIDIFNKADYEITIYATQYKGQARELMAEKGGNYDLVVVSGGDGTLNEAVSGLMSLENKPDIGYIPAGSTNDFGASIGLPKNMEKCAEMIIEGEPFACDIGQFNEKYFVYVAAFGAFSAVSYMTSQQAKNVLGHQAYILEGVKQVGNIKPIHMVFTYDNKQIEGDYLFGMISNATSVGGFKGITGGHVSMDDGLFEVTLIKNPENPLEVPLILSNMLLKEKDQRYITTFKCSELHVHSVEQTDWTLDGEFGGDCQDVEIRIYKKEVTILTMKQRI